MEIYCAWCKKELNGTKQMGKGMVTYDFCPTCREQLFPNKVQSSFQLFLDTLNAPVLIVDKDVRIIAGNEKAASLLGKSGKELSGRYGGEAIECAKARLPGGCGNTLHCRTCTIRIMVADTHATGTCHYNVPAYPDIYTPQASGGPFSFLISTEKSGDVVFLKIEPVA